MKEPIGIFDSGLGGLTVWKTLLKEFPNESFVYYADSANCPYGTKEDEQIIELSDQIVSFLLDKGCKAIVVACNTATSAAIAFLRRKYNVPIIGIEPAIKPASLLSKTGNIGVLATQSTIRGKHFNTTYKRYAEDKNVIIQVGFGLVEQVEKNAIEEQKTEELVRKYITPMLEANVDYIVLGCTHYPLLTPIIEKIKEGRDITLLEPSKAIANQTKAVLKQHNILNKDLKEKRKTIIYTTSKDTSKVQNILKLLNIPKEEPTSIHSISIKHT